MHFFETREKISNDSNFFNIRYAFLTNAYFLFILSETDLIPNITLIDIFMREREELNVLAGILEAPLFVLLS